ncbi:MAG TPA: sigma-70 family RNA polymerase sigma factor [Planctomycetaceae bacterium]|nr:sigma-70 family RNA polymerase sigma factor [Planctomycetaceae bacterium]
MISTPHFRYLHDPDVQLMLRVANDDSAAFSELVANYRKRLVGRLTQLLANTDDAEDVAQEVFIRVYKARRRYEATARFSTWLARITFNLAHNFLRDARRHKSAAPIVAAELYRNPRLVPESLVVDKRLAQRSNGEGSELEAVIHSALETLTERQRTAFLMQNIDEMSCRDIGAALGLKPGAVRTLLSRARRRLRERLLQHADGDHLGSLALMVKGSASRL